ncbi:hypothetical protein [Methylobacterium oryzisoli]|uniref:hypothetical protein n=1 Tax=Methylobacterium oryzisoli TaxID=3385502 RepID=UPI003891CA09
MKNVNVRRLKRRATKMKSLARREYDLFLEGLDAVWTACLGWVAIRTARLILS